MFESQPGFNSRSINNQKMVIRGHRKGSGLRQQRIIQLVHLLRKAFPDLPRFETSTAVETRQEKLNLQFTRLD